MKFIGLDIGTTSLTGLIYDLESCTVLHAITDDNFSDLTGRNAWERMQDPEVICRRIAEIVEQLMLEDGEIGGIGLSGQMHGIVYTDSKGRHVSQLYTWQDGRGALPYDDSGITYAGKLSELTGYTVAPGYGLATHFYNLKNGLVPAEAVSFCTIADYAALCLTGGEQAVIDATQAAAIGCYSLETGGFDTAALERAGISAELLPAAVPSGSLIGYTGSRIPVYCSLGDNQASFLGSVPEPEETVLLNIGTGSQLSVLLPADDVSAEGMEVRPYPGGGRLAVGAALSGGKSYALLERFFRDVISSFTGEEPGELYSYMAKLLNRETANGKGNGKGDVNALIVNTQFLGTRSNPEVRGSIGQITLDNFTPEHLTHGFLQGMVDELYAFYAPLIRTAGAAYRYVIGSGNALRANPVLCAKVEYAFGLPLTLSSSAEEAAVGAALCAAVGAGVIGSFREAGRYVSGTTSQHRTHY